MKKVIQNKDENTIHVSCVKQSDYLGFICPNGEKHLIYFQADDGRLFHFIRKDAKYSYCRRHSSVQSMIEHHWLCQCEVFIFDSQKQQLEWFLK